MKEDIKRLIYLLRNRRGMILSDSSFNSLKYYLIGCLDGLGAERKLGLNMQITEWLQKKLGLKFSVFWYDYVLHMADNDEEKASILLLEKLEEFIEEVDLI